MGGHETCNVRMGSGCK